MRDIPERLRPMLRRAEAQGLTVAGVAQHAWEQFHVAWLADLEAWQITELEAWLFARTKAATRPTQQALRVHDRGPNEPAAPAARGPRPTPRPGTESGPGGGLAAILAWVARTGEMGATDEEMQLGIPLDSNTQRPLRAELVRRGHIVNSGRTRRVADGRAATVWVTAAVARGAA